MTTDERPSGPPGQNDRKQPAPTLDLKATEVASEPVHGPPQPVETAAGEPPPAAQPAAQTTPSRRRGSRWALAAATGATGVALTLGVLVGTGMLSIPQLSIPPSAGGSGLEQRLTRLEQQLAELAGRPSPIAGDPKATDDLRALGERIGVLARRNDEIASIAGEARTRADAIAASLAELRKSQPSAELLVQRPEIEGLSKRIAALDGAIKAIESKLARANAEAAIDRSLRILLIANALNAAVDRGTPFVTELDAAKAIAPDPKSLAALDLFAKSGVPDVEALARELVALMPVLTKAAGTPKREGIFDRLKANAEKIVRITPIDEPTGDGPAAILQRIEVRAVQRNLAGAIAELSKLPEPVRVLAKEWVVRVEARNAAVEASRRFARDQLAAVGKPSL